MKFLSLERLFGKRRLGERARRRAERKETPASRRVRPRLEDLEDRTLMSVLPSPVVSGQGPLSVSGGANTGNTPSIVVDPADPQKLVAVWVDQRGLPVVGTAGVLTGAFSTDAGTTWTALTFTKGSAIGVPAVDFMTNPADTVVPLRPYLWATSPSVSFDRNHQFYIANSFNDNNTSNTGGSANSPSGTIAFNKFDFTSSTPTQVISNESLYRWVGQDVALNPVVAVDNNLSSYTDPATGAVQTDTMAGKAIYVAWNTNNTPSGFPGVTIDPNVIHVTASGDGGNTFTTDVLVNDNGNGPGLGHGAPQILFTQGTATPPGATPTVVGGQLVFVWQRSNGSLVVDSSQPDAGNLNQQAAEAVSFTDSSPQNTNTPFGGSGVTYGVSPGSGNTIPGISIFKQTLDMSKADPNHLFDSVVDMEVTLNLVSPDVGNLQVQLTGPTASGANATVTLFFAKKDTAGNDSPVPNFGLPHTANLGETIDANGGSHPVGTVFDTQSARLINDPNNVAPYVAHFRPEAGSLSVFDGLTRAQLDKSVWTLKITDNQPPANPPPPQFLSNWNLTFSADISTTKFGTDTTIPTPGSPPLPWSFNSPFPTASTASTRGLGATPVIAIDNSLGAFSPFQGRMYLAYTGTSNTFGATHDVVYLTSTDSLGPTSTTTPFWSTPVVVNDASPADGFSTGLRPAFDPSLTVDPVTGTVIVTYYDARWDAAQARVTRYIADSIDGGNTFGPETFLNVPRTATDDITGSTVTIEPLPDNEGALGNAGTQGFGDREGLAAYAGHVFALWAGNGNFGGSRMVTATTTIAAGPRIITSDMGPVVQDGSTGTYNNTFALDGTRQINGFTVTFDRPIDPASFTASDVHLVYHDTTSPVSATNPGTDLSNQITGITPLNNDGTPALTIGNAIIEATAAGTVLAKFPVFLSFPLVSDVTVNYSTTDGTATANEDYTPVTLGILNIPHGSTQGFISIPILPEAAIEGPQTFTVTLSNPSSGATLSNTTATGTILSANNPPAVTIGNASFLEGAKGTIQAGATIAAAPNGATESGSTVTITTTTAHTFQPGQVVQIAGVPVSGYDGIFTIVSVPTPTTFTYTDATTGLAASGGGTADVISAMLFPLYLSSPSSQPVMVNYVTADGTGPTGAVAGTDYTTESGVVTFAPGQTTQTIYVPIIGNQNSGPNKTFTVNLTTPVGATLADSQATGLIVNANGVGVSVGDVTVQNTTAPNPAVNAVFTIYLNQAYSQTVVIPYTTADGTGPGGAVAGTDYTTTSGMATFAPGVTSQTVTVPILQHATGQPNKSFFLDLGSPTAADGVTPINIGINRAQGTGLIVDNNAQPIVSIANTAALAGDPGSSTVMTFTVYLSFPVPVGQKVTVKYATSDGPAPSGAVAGVDYTASMGTLTINGGSNKGTINVPLISNIAPKPNRIFLLTLTNPTGATLAPTTYPGQAVGQAVGTIIDEAVNATIGSVTVQNSTAPANPVKAIFPVYLDGPKDVPVTINWTTANGSAKNGTDFTGGSGSIIIPAGQVKGAIAIPITQFASAQPNKSFSISITSTIANTPAPGNTAIGTIVDDNGGANLSISDGSAFEGDSSNPANFNFITFTVYLSAAQSSATTFNVNTFGGNPNVDYVPVNSLALSIPAGSLFTTFTVSVIGNTTLQNNRTFGVAVSNVSNGITVVRPTGTGLIVDDDRLALSVPDLGVPENGGPANFTVFLSNPSANPVSFEFSTSDGTSANPAQNALDPIDYTGVTNVFTIPAGQASASIPVTINGDQTPDPDKTFFFQLSNPVNARIDMSPNTNMGDAQGLIVDTNNLGLTVGNVTVAEGAPSVTFTVYLNGKTSKDVTFTYQTQDGTATSTTDYTTTSGTGTILAGSQSTTITVALTPTTAPDPNRFFDLVISNATNAGIIGAQGVATIIGGNALPALTVSDGSSFEGNSSNPANENLMTFTVYLSFPVPVGQTITVNYATADGPVAKAGVDYVATSGQLVFQPGQTSQTFTVPVIGNTTVDGNRSFLVNLSSPSPNATIARPQGTGLIVDDDGSRALVIGDALVAAPNTGTSTATFTVLLSAPSNTDVTVQWTTADGTAVAGKDYVAASGTLDIPAGQTSGTITVQVIGNTIQAPNKTFFVDLSNPAGATLANAVGTGTIINGSGQFGATEYLISITPQSKIGTYSYTIGPAIRDRIRTPGVALSVGDATAVESGAAGPAVAIAMTGATESGYTVTITTTTPHGFAVGQVVQVAGVGVAGYNGNFVITSVPTPTSFTYTAAQNGLAASGGGTANTIAAFVFPIVLDSVLPYDVTVGFATADDTALAGTDYVATTGTLVIPSGQSSGTVAVPILNDPTPDGTEDFFLQLNNPVGASVARLTGTGTIVDNKGPLTVSVSDATVQESTLPGLTASINTAPTGATEVGNTVTITTTSPHGFTAGQTVQISGVTTAGYNGTFTITSVPNATSFTYTDPVNKLKPSGNGTATTVVAATFTVFLNRAAGSDVTVAVNTSDHSAIAGDDYTSLGGPITVTIPAGSLSTTVLVPILGSTEKKEDVTFFVNLNNALLSGSIVVPLAKPRGVGLIIPNLLGPGVSIGDATVQEVPGSTTAATISFPVLLNTVLPTPVTVQYSTADGTALAGTDYVASTGTVTFMPGETAKVISVPLANPQDPVADVMDSFTVSLSNPVGAGLLRSSATGNLIDAGPASPPVISIDDPLALEGNSSGPNGGTVTFHVYLSQPSATAQTVDFSTADGSATTADGDYQFTSGTVTFAPGQTVQTITVPVFGDSDPEANETFFVTLANPSMPYTIVKATGTATLIDSAVATSTIAGFANAPVILPVDTQGASSPFPNRLPYVPAPGQLNLPIGPVTTEVKIASAPNGASEVGSTVTIVTQKIHGFLPGQVVQISGVGVAGYNGTFTIASVPNPTTFTYVNTVTKLAKSGGGIAVTIGTGIAAAPNGATESGGTVTIDTTAPHGFTVGQTVQISGVGDPGYDGQFVIASVPTPTTFTYVNPLTGLSNSGGGTVSAVSTGSTVTVSDVPAGQVIRDITVNLTINHPNPADLTILLVAPDGVSTVTLWQGDPFTTLSGSNFVDTTFDDLAGPANNIELALTNAPFGPPLPPFTGTFQPDTPLSALDGLNPNGTWTLQILDTPLSGDTTSGTLINWSMRIQTGVVSYAGSPGNFMDQNQNAFTADGVRDPSDAYMVPGPTTGVPYQAPYSKDTSPLIIPGPHLVTGHTFKADPTQVDLPIPPVGTGGSGDPAKDVTVSTIQVSGLPADRVISNLRVNLSLFHNNDTDLRITLISPQGTIVNLVNSNELVGADFTNTTFDDNATTAISAGAAPFTGSFIPDNPLGSFIGQNPNGTWTLKIDDTAVQNTGTLLGWSLNIENDLVLQSTTNHIDVTFDRDMNPATFTSGATYALAALTESGLTVAATTTVANHFVVGQTVVIAGVPVGGYNGTFTVTSTPTPTTFTYTDLNVGLQNSGGGNASTPPSVVSLTGPAGPIAGPFTIVGNPYNTDPNPLFPRTYQIQFPTQSISGVYTLVFGPNVQSANGDKMDTNLNAGLDLLLGRTVPGNPSFVPKVYSSTSPSVPLKPNASVISPLTVPDSFVIGPGTVLTLNINYTGQAKFLSAALVAPDGTTIPLFANVGAAAGLTGGYNNTMFSDSFTTPIQAASAPPFSAMFRPKQPLDVLAGKQAHGAWTLVVNNGSAASGSIGLWTLSLQDPQATSGLGEANADQATAIVRIFTTAASNPQSHDTWTAVGPTSIYTGTGLRDVGRVTAIAVDPSDPSGNTVYIGAATGGIWKTTDFLTTDPVGPRYVPLTDFGPSYSLNIGSITVFPHNNDPNQSIIFAGTGEGDAQASELAVPPSQGASSPNVSPTGPAKNIDPSYGVGFLRSLDGGKTWTLLDSTTNVNTANGQELPLSSPTRDHAFVGTTTFKVVVDPTKQSNGGVIVYAALGKGTTASNGGLYVSKDTGNTWTKITGAWNATDDVTDVTLVPQSVDPTNGTLANLYVAVEGTGSTGGVWFSSNHGQSFSHQTGGAGNANNADRDRGGNPAVPVTPPAATPNGANGRIELAVPFATGIVRQDIDYINWVYALVATPGGAFNGLYLSKDSGANWTQVKIPGLPLPPPPFAPSQIYPTNDDTQANYDAIQPQANYDMTLTIDPLNPNVVYIGGSDKGFFPGGLIRVDTTGISDPFAFVANDNRDADGGQLFGNTVGQVWAFGAYQLYFQDPLSGNLFLLSNAPTPFLNLIRDPRDPFNPASTPLLHGDPAPPLPPMFFTNDGSDIKQWGPFGTILPDGTVSATNLILNGTTNIHTAVSFVDPLTGMARLIFGDDQGVFTGVARPDGTLEQDLGTQQVVTGDRNGDLQITEFYYGASQPSQLAADLGGALLYGTAQDNGPHAQSVANILASGNLGWQQHFDNPLGTGVGVATDAGGSGTAYTYVWPNATTNFEPQNFFEVTPPGGTPTPRTHLLFLTAGGGVPPDPEWDLLGGSTFAVNPVSNVDMVMSSSGTGPNLGTIFRTRDQGLNWNVIGSPANDGMDGTYAQAVAYGAPQIAKPGQATPPIDDFIYAGTIGGHIYVTFTGGGNGSSNLWIPLSTGLLDSSSVEQIITSPVRGSHAAFAVTRTHVYYMPDSSAAGATWIDITGNLFSFTFNPFNNPNLKQTMLQYLTTIAVDWRADKGNGLTNPIVYAGGLGGVFRTTNPTAATPVWSIFPNTTMGALVNGGLLPDVLVTSLNLSLGNVDPNTGVVDANQATGPALLTATTYGRGVFAIRVDDNLIPGPHVVGSTPQVAGPGITSVTVNFSGPVDPSTFSPPVSYTITAATEVGTTVGIQTQTTHNLVVGQQVQISGVGVSGYDGTFTVTSVPTPNTFTYTDPTAGLAASGGGTVTATSLQILLGGPNGAIPVLSVVDLTPGAVNIPILAVTEAGSSVTVFTLTPQTLAVGQTVTISGVGIGGYNGTFVVTSVPSSTSFTYTDQTTGLSNSGGGNVNVAGSNAHTQFQINFPSQTVPGTYIITLRPGIADFAGDQLDQDQDWPKDPNGSPDDFDNINFTISNSDDGHFVSGLYHDLLGRGADYQGFTAFTGLLDNARNALMRQLATALVVTPEARGDLVAGLYQSLLGRAASPAEVGAWVQAMQLGVGLPQIEAALVDSAEYFQKATVGQQDSSFINQIYLDLLGRPADAGSAANFLNYLTGVEQQGRVQETSAIDHSLEYYTDVVVGLYNTYLRRSPSSNEIIGGVQALAQGATDEQLIASLVGSAEYLAFATNPANGVPGTSANEQFVNLAFHDILGRSLSGGGATASDPTAQAFLAALNAGQLNRLQAAVLLLGTNEYRATVVTADFAKYLKRAPGGNELPSYVNYLAAGNSDEQLLTLVVSSAEFYQDQAGADTRLPQTDADWVNALYAQVLGRAADSQALAQNTAFLAAGETNARSFLVSVLANSNEFLGDLIDNANTNTGLYPWFLHRAASPAEVNAWIPVLRASFGPGAPTGYELIESAIISSPEYFNDQVDPNPAGDPNLAGVNTSRGWLNSLYLSPHLLNRDPHAGQANQDPGFGGNLQFVVGGYQNLRTLEAAVILQSPEYKTDLVTSYYTNFLRRPTPPSAAEISGLVGVIGSALTDEQVQGILLGSAEYFSVANNPTTGVPGATPNQKFVNLLYHDLLNRSLANGGATIADNGAANFANALDQGRLTRAQVINALLASTEYLYDVVTAAYTKELHRNPAPQDLAGWALGLQQGLRDEQLLAALISSTEYFLDGHPLP